MALFASTSPAELTLAKLNPEYPAAVARLGELRAEHDRKRSALEGLEEKFSGLTAGTSLDRLEALQKAGGRKAKDFEKAKLLEGEIEALRRELPILAQALEIAEVNVQTERNTARAPLVTKLQAEHRELTRHIRKALVALKEAHQAEEAFLKQHCDDELVRRGDFPWVRYYFAGQCRIDDWLDEFRNYLMGRDY